MPKAVAYYKVQLNNTDKSVELMQDSIERVLQPLTASPIVSGSLLQNVELSAGTVNRVEHKLGRKLLGYIIVLKNANANIHDAQQQNKRTDLFLDLETTADCTVSLWVF